MAAKILILCTFFGAVIASSQKQCLFSRLISNNHETRTTWIEEHTKLIDEKTRVINRTYDELFKKLDDKIVRNKKYKQDLLSSFNRIEKILVSQKLFTQLLKNVSIFIEDIDKGASECIAEIRKGFHEELEKSQKSFANLTMDLRDARIYEICDRSVSKIDKKCREQAQNMTNVVEEKLEVISSPAIYKIKSMVSDDFRNCLKINEIPRMIDDVAKLFINAQEYSTTNNSFRTLGYRIKWLQSDVFAFFTEINSTSGILGVLRFRN